MINLYDIYKKVSDRHRRLEANANISEGTLLLSEIMKETARAIIDKPTLKNVKMFRSAEMKWYKSPEIRVNTDLHAHTFESVIRSKKFTIKKPVFNQSKFDWDAKDGIVYCLTCSSKPDQVKIGGCSKMTLHERLLKLKNRYHKDDILILEFAYKTNETAKLESEIQSELVQVSGRTKKSSKEWYLTTPSRAKKLLLSLSKENGFIVTKIRENALIQTNY